MVTLLALPPIPIAPAQSSPLATWQAYWDVAKMHRTQEREEAYDAEMVRHNRAMEAASEANAAAMRANAEAGVAHASNTGAIVASDLAAQARRRADWITSIAKDILIDRTATTTSIANRAKMIKDAVADAIDLVDEVNAVLNPPPSPVDPTQPGAGSGV